MLGRGEKGEQGRKGREGRGLIGASRT